jgi:hypothetical protein
MNVTFKLLGQRENKSLLLLLKHMIYDATRKDPHIKEYMEGGKGCYDDRPLRYDKYSELIHYPKELLALVYTMVSPELMLIDMVEKNNLLPFYINHEWSCSEVHEYYKEKLTWSPTTIEILS